MNASTTSFNAKFGISWSWVSGTLVTGSKWPTLYKEMQTVNINYYKIHQEILRLEIIKMQV